MIVANDRQLNNQNQTQIQIVGETSFVGQLNQNLTALFLENYAHADCLPNLNNGNEIIKTESCDRFLKDFVNSKSKTIVARNFNDDVITKNSRTGADVDGKFISERFFVNFYLVTVINNPNPI